jgi:alpha-tubulin suppressor-like RCC1 family protein
MTPSWFMWGGNVAGGGFAGAAVAAGNNHSIFVNSSGNVWTCGYNYHGQLGRAVAEGSVSSGNLGQVDGLPGITAAAAGSSHSIFLDSSGNVWNCGENGSGQLGRAVADSSATTINLGQVSGLSNIVAIAVGDFSFSITHSVFLDSSGKVWTCGDNTYGQLGRDVASGSRTVVNLGQVPGLSNIVAVAAGFGHSSFLDSSGNVWNCGFNYSGQLGRAVVNGSTSSVNLGQVPGLSNIVAVGGYYHSIFVNSSGNVWNCGNNQYGQLGRDVASGSRTVVNLGQVPGLSNIVVVAAGHQHSIFVNSSGGVWNCGNNQYGQLGRAVADGSATTVNLGQVSGLSSITTVAGGVYHPIFLDSSGNVWTCGYNQYGQLGRAVASGSATSVNLGQIPPENFAA